MTDTPRAIDWNGHVPDPEQASRRRPWWRVLLELGRAIRAEDARLGR